MPSYLTQEGESWRNVSTTVSRQNNVCVRKDLDYCRQHLYAVVGQRNIEIAFSLNLADKLCKFLPEIRVVQMQQDSNFCASDAASVQYPQLYRRISLGGCRAESQSSQ